MVLADDPTHKGKELACDTHMHVTRECDICVRVTLVCMTAAGFVELPGQFSGQTAQQSCLCHWW